MTEEIWKNINLENFEDNYQVSNFGRVRSLDREFVRKSGRLQPVKGRILKQQTDRYGYKYVFLYNQGLGKKMTVHRLVALTFIPNNTKERDQINHKDSVRDNNSVNNLEWVTGKENSEHAYKHGNGIRGFEHHGSKNVLIEYKESPITLFGSLSMCSEALGVPRKTLGDYINNSRLLFDELTVSFTDKSIYDFDHSIIEDNFVVNKLDTLAGKPVAVYGRDNKLLSAYQSMSEAEKTNGIKPTGLTYPRNNKTLYRKKYYVRDISQYEYVTCEKEKINLRVIYD